MARQNRRQGEDLGTVDGGRLARQLCTATLRLPRHPPPYSHGLMSAPPALTLDLAAFAAALPALQPLIGIDLGDKTLGIALSDRTRMIATALETIQRTKFTTDALRLAALVAKHDVAGLVLGLPLSLDGSEGPRVQATRAFARNLLRTVTLPLLLFDERLSTVAAERMLIDADVSRKKRKAVIDQVASTIILQGALDRMRAVRDRGG